MIIGEAKERKGDCTHYQLRGLNERIDAVELGGHDGHEGLERKRVSNIINAVETPEHIQPVIRASRL